MVGLTLVLFFAGRGMFVCVDERLTLRMRFRTPRLALREKLFTLS